MRRALLALGTALLLSPVAAHDLITAESAEHFLAQIRHEQDVLGSQSPPQARAQASVALGKLLDEIRDLLNRDIASHGQPQGLATLYLIQALHGQGIDLQRSPRLGRYPANLAFYRSALQLDPHGPASAEARLQLLRGHFYDSFEQDPLRPREQSWPQLREQIEHAQALLQQTLPEPGREEAHFILAVHYLQAAATAGQAAVRSAYAQRARTAIAQFKARYPDSLRVAALDVLDETLGKR